MSIGDQTVADFPIAGDVSFIFTADVAEVASAVDTLSSTGTFSMIIAESVTALDSVAAGDAHFLASLVEAASALDTLSSVGVLHSTVSEAANAEDTLSAVGAFNVGVIETTATIDTLSASQMRVYWFLDFSEVVPSPPGEGPGNPGKLFGNYHLEPLRGRRGQPEDT